MVSVHAQQDEPDGGAESRHPAAGLLDAAQTATEDGRVSRVRGEVGRRPAGAGRRLYTDTDTDTVSVSSVKYQVSDTDTDRPRVQCQCMMGELA